MCFSVKFAVHHHIVIEYRVHFLINEKPISFCASVSILRTGSNSNSFARLTPRKVLSVLFIALILSFVTVISFFG